MEENKGNEFDNLNEEIEQVNNETKALEEETEELEEKPKRPRKKKNISKAIFKVFFGFVGVLLIVFVFFLILSPSLKLKGDDLVVIEYNNVFKEPGYEAKYLGKDISDKVYLVTNLDISKIGDYEIQYLGFAHLADRHDRTEQCSEEHRYRRKSQCIAYSGP